MSSPYGTVDQLRSPGRNYEPGGDEKLGIAVATRERNGKQNAVPLGPELPFRNTLFSTMKSTNARCNKNWKHTITTEEIQQDASSGHTPLSKLMEKRQTLDDTSHRELCWTICIKVQHEKTV